MLPSQTRTRAIELVAAPLDDPACRRLEAAAIAECVAFGEFDQQPLPATVVAPPNGGFFLVRLGGMVVGCGGFYLDRDTAGDAANLTRIYVVSEARRHGIGVEIVTGCERRAGLMGAGEMRAETGTERLGAMCFWRAMGYDMAEPVPGDRTRRFVRSI